MKCIIHFQAAYHPKTLTIHLKETLKAVMEKKEVKPGLL